MSTIQQGPDIQAARAARWSAVDARTQKARTALDTLLDTSRPLWWTRIYSTRIQLGMSNNTVALGSFTVDQNEVFFGKEVQAVYEVSGVLAEDGTSQGIVQIPESIRPLIMDYTWFIRDSGGNREWSSAPVPSSVLRGGNTNGLQFKRGHARVRGGSQVLVTINTTFLDLSSNATGMKTFTGHWLTLCVKGVSVRPELLQ